MIDDNSKTASCALSLILHFPHLTKAEEKELEADGDPLQQAGGGYRLQPSGDSWLKWRTQEVLVLNP